MRERELDDLFHKYGRIVDVAVKHADRQCYAFVTFEDARDATDAVRGRNGIEFGGSRLRCVALPVPCSSGCLAPLDAVSLWMDWMDG